MQVYAAGPKTSINGRSRLADVPRALLQNEYADRSLRRECVDQVVILDERHLRHVLLSDMEYDDGARRHLSSNQDAPAPRAVWRAGHIVADYCRADCIIKSPDLICDKDNSPEWSLNCLAWINCGLEAGLLVMGARIFSSRKRRHPAIGTTLVTTAKARCSEGMTSDLSKRGAHKGMLCLWPRRVSLGKQVSHPAPDQSPGRDGHH